MDVVDKIANVKTDYNDMPQVMAKVTVENAEGIEEPEIL